MLSRKLILNQRLNAMWLNSFAGKYLSTSLILSDTDDDSDDESTVFEAKKRSMNGSVNGYIRKDTWCDVCYNAISRVTSREYTKQL